MDLAEMTGALSEGTRIGGFELGGVIGRGGFGITYRARDRDGGKVYAIKEYLPEEFAQRENSGRVTSRPGRQDPYTRGKQAFMDEANVLKDLPRREGLVRVRGAFEKFGTAYCVMEFIEGDSLDRMANRMIAKLGHVPEPLLLDLAVAVLWALDALHRVHIIHRDVKPANIMVRRSGKPVVIDFGAARRLSRSDALQAIFTRSYAAIEQFPPELTRFGRSFEEGPWSDVYSLAVVLHEIVAHARPPDAQSRAEAVLSGQPDPYVPLARRLQGTERASLYSEDVLDAIDAGLALMPQARIRSARAFAEALRPGAWDEIEAEAPDEPTGPATELPGVDAAPSRGRWGRVALIAACVLLATAAIYLFADARTGTETF